MKFISTFILLFLVFTIHAQTPNINDSTVELLLNKINAKTITPDEKKELKAKAFIFQNYGQGLDEEQHDYKQSLQYVNKAIVIFNSLNDTLNIANNKKFKGYLLGRSGNFTEAKIEINSAIELFQAKGAAWGVAVSQFDLSRVYEFENKLDSAVYFSSIALVYWKSVNNNARVLILQTMLINLYTKAKDFNNAKAYQKDAEKLISDPELHWLNLIDFYFVSEKLFEKLMNPSISNRYKDLYDSKLKELAQKGIFAKSYYAQVHNKAQSL